jgi:hypothetical protein
VPGHTIEACYDLVRRRSLPEYDRLYREPKDQLAQMGLDFD